MFERFTDRARRVMALASLEALRFDGEYIAPEHMLLGLARLEEGIIAVTFTNPDLTRDRIQKEVRSLLDAGSVSSSTRAQTQAPVV